MAAGIPAYEEMEEILEAIASHLDVVSEEYTGPPVPADKISGGRRGMNISPKTVRFDADSFWVDLSDGRTLGVPLAWFPRLLDATPEQREGAEIGATGLHWDALDEDISIAGLLAGRGDRTRLGRERKRAAGKTGAA